MLRAALGAAWDRMVATGGAEALAGDAGAELAVAGPGAAGVANGEGTTNGAQAAVDSEVDDAGVAFDRAAYNVGGALGNADPAIGEPADVINLGTWLGMGGVPDTSESAAPPVALRPLIRAYCSARRSEVELNPVEREGLRTRELELMPADLRAVALAEFKDDGVIALPGFLNFFPGDEFVNPWAAVAGHGAVVIGVARDHGEQGDRGLYRHYGGDIRVLQPYWPMELAIVVERLHDAFTDSTSSLGRAQRYIVLCHSKGYFLGHALQQLSQDPVCRTTGLLPERYYRFFPRLRDVPSVKIAVVLQRLCNARFIGIAAPVEGLERFLNDRVVDIFSRRLMSDSGRCFRPDFIAHYHNNVARCGPESCYRLITTRHPGTILRSLGSDTTTTGGPIRKSVSLGARALFYGMAGLLSDGSGDGVVPGYKGNYPNQRKLSLEMDHLGSFERRAAAHGIMAAMIRP